MAGGGANRAGGARRDLHPTLLPASPAPTAAPPDAHPPRRQPPLLPGPILPCAAAVVTRTTGSSRRATLHHSFRRGHHARVASPTHGPCSLLAPLPSSRRREDLKRPLIRGD
jgi:hypothetical protein